MKKLPDLCDDLHNTVFMQHLEQRKELHGQGAYAASTHLRILAISRVLFICLTRCQLALRKLIISKFMLVFKSGSSPREDGRLYCIAIF